MTRPCTQHDKHPPSLTLLAALFLASLGAGIGSPHAGMFDDILHKAGKDVEDALRKGMGQPVPSRPMPPVPPPGQTEQRPASTDVYADQRAKAATDAERKRQEVENETYTQAEQQEIDSQTYNGPSRTVAVSPSQIYAWRNGWEGRLIGYHYAPLYRPASRAGSLPYKGFYRLTCSYEANKSPGSMQFWYRRRPVTEIARPENLQGSDVAVEVCPQVYGDALKLVYGEDILDRATAWREERDKYASMSKAERDAYSEQQRAKQREQRYGVYATWDRDAKANSPARDKELVRAVNAGVSSLQRTGRGLSVATLRQALDNGLRDNLLSLARSAKARLDAIPAGPENRAAFDHWDNEVGGHMLLALRRLATLQGSLITGNDADFRVAGENDSIRALRRTELQNNRELDFTVPVHQFFDGAFQKRLAGQPLLDRPYVAEMKKKLNATRVLSDKWRATVDAPPARNSDRESQELMTLDELAAAEFGGVMGRGLAGAMDGYLKVKQANAAFQQRITSARENFWTCYANRCADAPQRYFEYSKALRDKDMYYMMTPEIQMRIGGKQQAMGMEMLMGMMGSLAIDGGPGREGCSSDWENAKASLTLHLGNWKPDLTNIEASREELAKRVAAFTLGPDYGKWQQCRDYQEYMDRPRPLK